MYNIHETIKYSNLILKTNSSSEAEIKIKFYGFNIIGLWTQ